MKLIILALIAIPSLSPGADNEWKKAKEKDGITVFTRQTENSNIKEFKAEGIIEGTLVTLKKVFKDVDNYCEWVSDCKTTKKLEVSQKELIHYMEISVPFPFDNRDMIQKSVFEMDSKTLKVSLTNLPEYLPEEKGRTRLPIAEGYWLFQEIGPGEIKATLQYLSDPGGSIPSWLVNLFIVEGPLKNIQNLRLMVQKEQYN